jgi:hypothetical protein
MSFYKEYTIKIMGIFKNIFECSWNIENENNLDLCHVICDMTRCDLILCDNYGS